MRHSATTSAWLVASYLTMLCAPAGGSPAGSGRSFFADAKLNASDGAPVDQFGAAMAISGNTLVVGARLHGDSSSGSAYIFERDADGPGAWEQVASLTAADGAADDHFGESVAINGDTVVVGANGDDDLGPNSGSAYIFGRNAGGPGNWGQVAKLTAGDGGAFDAFGDAVAISGDSVVVGAPTHDAIDFDAGAAYIYERDAGGPGQWGEVTKLTASDGGNGDYFGLSLAISGATVVVAANGDRPGSAYVFERGAGGPGHWGEVAKLIGSGGGPFDLFPDAVVIDGDTIVAAASSDDEIDTSAGATYIFERDAGGPGNWGQVAKLTAPDAAAFDSFGASVAIAGATLVVGARNDDDLGINSGSAYVYERDAGGPGNWGKVAKLTGPDGGTRDEFGRSVALDGGTVVVGAPLDDDLGSDAGAAYVFEETLIDPALAASGACPDGIGLVASRLTARGAIELYSGSAEGASALASGPCVGTELGLEQPMLVGAGRATGDGTKSGVLTLSEQQCGFLQLVDLTSCATSALVPVP